ncbi:acyl-CoA dehydrogenase family protein [Amycolatopsis sp. WAC 04197]|uniref:acyl-CoA dehydrogenase family protein n=1 Tax=Amycolatopsis sp. WAC 04197 TaxID=2203199 RepID=UPI00131536AE|nr:acyl-CoA dehydrogenase family protein [Amycolatopsis sp. WAC 04197]
MLTTVPDGLLSTKAEEIAKLADEHAAVADARRHLEPKVVEALAEGGFLRHFVPAAFGGRQGGFLDLLKAVDILGRACPSTAWMASLLAHGGRMVAHLPEEGKEALWSGGPDVYIASGLVPGGEMRLDGGGWRISGRWTFVSGADLADWTLLSSFPSDGAEKKPWCFIVPKKSLFIEDTWFNLGMRATGSNTVVLDGVFVPRGHAFERASLEAGLPAGEPDCHRVPLKAVNGLSFAGPLLGAAKGMVDRWTTWMTVKKAGPDGRRPADRDNVRHDLARSTAGIGAAALLLENVARRADGGGTSTDDIERNMLDWSFATTLIRDAADLIFSASGTSAHHEGHELQRFWRDIHSASSHFALSFTNAAGLFGGKVFSETR